MAMLRILLASDGSRGAFLAADWVRRCASQNELEVHVAVVERQVTVPMATPFEPGTITYKDAKQNAEVEAQEALELTLERLQITSRDHATVLNGPVVQELVNHAAALQADMIVVGRRGHGLLESVVLGSVSLGLVRHSHIPVLVVPAQP